jgi:hypothetical protein
MHRGAESAHEASKAGVRYVLNVETGQARAKSQA